MTHCNYARRAWDSNPRDVSAHQFSRLAPSATRTALPETQGTIVTGVTLAHGDIPPRTRAESHATRARIATPASDYERCQPLKRCKNPRNSVIEIGAGELVRHGAHLIRSLAHRHTASLFGCPGQHVDVVASVSDHHHSRPRDALPLANPLERGRLVDPVGRYVEPRRPADVVGDLAQAHPLDDLQEVLDRVPG